MIKINGTRIIMQNDTWSSCLGLSGMIEISWKYSIYAGFNYENCVLAIARQNNNKFDYLHVKFLFLVMEKAGGKFDSSLQKVLQMFPNEWVPLIKGYYCEWSDTKGRQYSKFCDWGQTFKPTCSVLAKQARLCFTLYCGISGIFRKIKAVFATICALYFYHVEEDRKPFCQI